jgi:hypothetical protein
MFIWKRRKGDKKWARKRILTDFDWDSTNSGVLVGSLKEQNTNV